MTFPDDEDRRWFDWRDWDRTDLYIVMFVIALVLFVTHRLHLWGD